MRKTAPKSVRRLQTHVRPHEQVVSSEHWYGDAPPALGKGFTAAETTERHALVTEILLRAGKRADKNGPADLAKAYYELLDKLALCKARRRCGSLACPRCARAFQKAKIAAQKTAIDSAAKDRPDKRLVFVTVIPKNMMYPPGQFQNIDVKKENRWLKDALKAAGKGAILGSIDFSWETRRGAQYLQLHWHFATWTTDPVKLKEKLAAIFLRKQKYERPVDVTVAEDLGFLPYMNKAIKWNDLLRRNRTHLPELLLVLDRTDPLDLMVMTKFRLSAQQGSLALRPIGGPKRKSSRTES
jgi:hypothetical protein